MPYRRQRSEYGPHQGQTPRSALREMCAFAATGDGKKVAQSFARERYFVFHVIASSGALQKSEERSRATTGSPKSRRLGLSVSSRPATRRRSPCFGSIQSANLTGVRRGKAAS